MRRECLEFSVEACREMLTLVEDLVTFLQTTKGKREDKIKTAWIEL